MDKEDYVSFETAKLLKGKGFDFKCDKCYAYFADDDIRVLDLKYAKSAQLLIENRYPCVTIQMAMRWLREVHNVMISPYALSLGYYFEIFDLTNRDVTGCKPLYKVGVPNKEDVLSTYEESCETAINYYLEKLIETMDKNAPFHVWIGSNVQTFEDYNDAEECFYNNESEYQYACIKNKFGEVLLDNSKEE